MQIHGFSRQLRECHSNSNSNSNAQQTNNKQQTTNNKQQATTNQQPTTNNKERTTNSEQQTTNKGITVPSPPSQPQNGAKSAIELLTSRPFDADLNHRCHHQHQIGVRAGILVVEKTCKSIVLNDSCMKFDGSCTVA